MIGQFLHVYDFNSRKVESGNDTHLKRTSFLYVTSSTYTNIGKGYYFNKVQTGFLLNVTERNSCLSLNSTTSQFFSKILLMRKTGKNCFSKVVISLKKVVSACRNQIHLLIIELIHPIDLLTEMIVAFPNSQET